MGRTFIRQDAQIAQSFTYDDSRTPSLANYETNATDIEYDLNSLRSAINNLLNRSGASFPSDNWYDDISQPTTLENGTQRGVDAVNAALHAVEKKRVLRDVYDPGNDVAVPATQNYVILAVGELPSNTTAAIGAVTTLGTVAAYDSVFTGNTLDKVSGTNNLNPKNLCIVTDAATGDPILSAGRTIYALFQTESNTDGSTMTGTTPNRAKLSFVRPNATFDDLEACPVADIESKTINYATRERVRLEDLTEQDFLKGAVVDVPAGSTPTRQTVYDNQGATPVDVTTNSILDLEGAGLSWEIRDDLEASLFKITEGSAGGTTTIAIGSDVDVLDINAADVDFSSGIAVGSAGTEIAINETAGVVERAANLILRASGSGELYLDDSNQPVSWAQTDGIKLSETSTEWSDYETEFGGEVSLLRGIYLASHKAGRAKGQAILQADVSANTDVDATTSGNLDVDLPDYSGVGLFADDCDVFLNGELLRGAAGATEDVYPGTTPAQGMLKFTFALKGTGTKPDQLTMMVYNS